MWLVINFVHFNGANPNENIYQFGFDARARFNLPLVHVRHLTNFLLNNSRFHTGSFRLKMHEMAIWMPKYFVVDICAQIGNIQITIG